MGASDSGGLQLSAGPEVFVDTRRTACDVSKYIPPGAFLQVKAYCSVANMTLVLDFHHVDAQGHVIRSEQSIPLTSTRASNPSTIPLAEGYLVAACVRVNGNTPFIGNVWCRVSLILAGGGINFISHTLIQGYVTGTNMMTWPSGRQYTTAEPMGFMRSVQGTLPGAGSEIAETVPTGAIWRLVTFNYSLTTSATVANRAPGFIIDDGTNVLLSYPSIANVAAGATAGFNAVAGSNLLYTANTPIIWPVPQEMWLPAGFRIRTLTAALQAGDQYTAPSYFVEELMYE